MSRWPESVTSRDGVELRLRQWPLATARGVVLVVHGLGEHSGRYAWLASQLNACGWQVVGYDQRGHGGSTGPRGGVAAADDLLSDLALVVDATRAAHPGQSLIVLGHSMGGLVAARFVAESIAAAGQRAAWQRDVEALVLSSPALDPGMNLLQRTLVAVLAPLTPALALSNGLDPAWVSRDAAVVAAYKSDPLVHDRITPRLARFVVDGARVVRDRAARWQISTLLLWAGADRCVAPAGSAAFATAAPPRVVQSQCFDGLAHEIFNEPERDQVFGVLAAWLRTRGA